MHLVRTLRRRALLGVQSKPVGHMDAANDEHVAVFLDLADRLRREVPLACWDLARFQRTAKAAGESAGGRGYKVIERRVTGLVHRLVNAVVLGDRGVDAEIDGFCMDGKKRAPQRPSYPFNPHL